MNKPHFDRPEIDNSNSPVLAVKYPPDYADSQFATFMQELEVWTAATTEPYAWVIDIPQASARARKIIADSQNRRAVYERQYCTCYAYVISNAFLRNIITAVLWMSPPPGDYEVFAQKDDAVAWAKEKHAQVLAQPKRNAG